MRSLVREAQLALHTLRRRPAFAAAATIATALGVGTTVAMFSVIDGVLLRPLPYPDAGQLVAVFRTYPSWRRDDMLRARWDQIPFSLTTFRAWRATQTAFADIGAWTPGSATLSGGMEPEEVRLVRATASLLPLLGVRAAFGRTFLPGEDAPSAPRLALVTHEYWTMRLGGDPAVLGRTIFLDEQPYAVIGVLPPGVNLTGVADAPPIWINAGHHPSDQIANNNLYRVIARLKSGVGLAQATAETEQLVRGDTDPAKLGVRLAPWQVEQTKTARRPLLVLLGASGILLLISCVNVAVLLLGEVPTREHEVAVRVALGARRARIVRQLLSESVVLAVIGAALGTALAFVGTRVLVALAPREIPRLATVAVDLRVLGFAVAATAVTGVLCGVLPALLLAATSPASVLRVAERAASARRGAVQLILVAAEVGLGAVLLVGAVLLARSLARLSAVEPGFRAGELLVVRVGLSRGRYGDSASVHAFYRGASDRLSALPGVVGVSGSTSVPFTSSTTSTTLEPERRRGSPEAPGVEARFGFAFPGYFETMGIPLLDGRTFSAADNSAAPAIIVSETFARRAWPNERAVGQHVRWGDTPTYTVVGVVGDVKEAELGEDAQPAFYLAAVADRRPSPILVLRTRVDPRALVAAVRRAIGEVDPAVPVVAAEPMWALLARSTASQRFRATLISIFGVLAVVLAAVAVFGVTTRAVARRRHEVAIRMALGSPRRAVVGLLLTHTLGATAAGLAIGTLGALAGSRVLTPYLFGVSAADPVTYAGVAAALAAVSGMACWLPARRAVRASPAAVLHER